MTKSEIMEKLKPRCNGYDLPLSLNLALVAEILTEQSVGGNAVLPCVIGRFFKEMAEKHKVNIEALNLHIDGKNLYVQKYEYGAYPEFTGLETFYLNDL